MSRLTVESTEVRLTQILASVPGGERYRVAAFDSESYGVWILGRSEGHCLLRTVRAGLTKAR